MTVHCRPLGQIFTHHCSFDLLLLAFVSVPFHILPGFQGYPGVILMSGRFSLFAGGESNQATFNLTRKTFKLTTFLSFTRIMFLSFLSHSTSIFARLSLISLFPDSFPPDMAPLSTILLPFPR